MDVVPVARVNVTWTAAMPLTKVMLLGIWAVAAVVVRLVSWKSDGVV